MLYLIYSLMVSYVLNGPGEQVGAIFLKQLTAIEIDELMNVIGFGTM